MKLPDRFNNERYKRDLIALILKKQPTIFLLREELGIEGKPQEEIFEKNQLLKLSVAALVEIDTKLFLELSRLDQLHQEEFTLAEIIGQ